MENNSHYLRNKTVYLCGSIHSSSDDGVGWRETITPQLKKFGLEVLDPCKKNNKLGIDEIGKDKEKFRNLVLKQNWKKLKKDFWGIVHYDLRCCDKADFIIFNYDTKANMVGSIHELTVANFEKKPILLLYDKAQLKDFNPWVATFVKAYHFFSGREALFSYLQNVDKGEFDTSLWVV